MQHLPQNKKSSSAEWLYIVCVSSLLNKLRVKVVFKQADASQYVHKQTKQEQSYSLDFQNLTLGQGSFSEKQQRLSHIVQDILSDQKQLKNCRQVIQQIKDNRKTSQNQSVDESMNGSDFIQRN